jgi:hypothetical protein
MRLTLKIVQECKKYAFFYLPDLYEPGAFAARLGP